MNLRNSSNSPSVVQKKRDFLEAASQGNYSPFVQVSAAYLGYAGRANSGCTP